MQNIFKALFFIMFSLHVKTLFSAQNEQSSGYSYLEHNHQQIKHALEDLLIKARQRFDNGQAVFYHEEHGMYVSSRPGHIERLDEPGILFPAHYEVANSFFSRTLHTDNFKRLLEKSLANASPESLLKELN